MQPSKRHPHPSLSLPGAALAPSEGPQGLDRLGLPASGWHAELWAPGPQASVCGFGRVGAGTSCSAMEGMRADGDVPLWVPLHFRRVPTEPRPWVQKRLVHGLHWVPAERGRPSPRLQLLSLYWPRSVFTKLPNVSQPVRSCVAKNYARQIDRCLPVCALDPVQTDEKKWPHAAALTTSVLTQVPRGWPGMLGLVMIVSTVAMRGTLALAQGFHDAGLGFLTKKLLDFQTSDQLVLCDSTNRLS